MPFTRWESILSKSFIVVNTLIYEALPLVLACVYFFRKVVI